MEKSISDLVLLVWIVAPAPPSSCVEWTHECEHVFTWMNMNEHLTPNVMVLEDRGFGRWLKLDRVMRVDPHGGISALVRRGRWRELALSSQQQNTAKRKKIFINEKIPHVHGLKTWYCQDVSTSQTDLWIQCNPYQNPNDIFCRHRKVHPKIYIYSQGILSSQNNLEKEGQIWRTNTFWF